MPKEKKSASTTPTRRSKRILNAKEKHLSTANDPFWLKEESTLLLAFSHLGVHELLRCAATSTTWRKCIDHNAIAWTTAMWELDPLAVLGPKGAKAAVARLQREGGSDAGVHGKLWLALATRLASRSCAGFGGSCPVRGFELHISSLTRLCADCKENLDIEVAKDYKTLINDFMFDDDISAQVSTPEELLHAMETVHEGACIEIVGELHFTEEHAKQLMIRAVGDPLHYRYCFFGDGEESAIISRHSTLLFNRCMLQGLALEAGYEDISCECDDCKDKNDDLDEGDYEEFCRYLCENHFPAIEVADGAHLLLKDCTIIGNMGTGLMVNGGCVGADGCQFSSRDRYLGAVLKNETEGGARPLLSCRDCVFCDNMWGLFIPKGVDEKIVKSFIAANEFEDNSDEDVTRMYDYQTADVQPWRRGWANEE